MNRPTTSDPNAKVHYNHFGRVIRNPQAYWAAVRKREYDQRTAIARQVVTRKEMAELDRLEREAELEWDRRRHRKMDQKINRDTRAYILDAKREAGTLPVWFRKRPGALENIMKGGFGTFGPPNTLRSKLFRAAMGTAILNRWQKEDQYFDPGAHNIPHEVISPYEAAELDRLEELAHMEHIRKQRSRVMYRDDSEIKVLRAIAKAAARVKIGQQRKMRRSEALMAKDEMKNMQLVPLVTENTVVTNAKADEIHAETGIRLRSGKTLPDNTYTKKLRLNAIERKRRQEGGGGGGISDDEF